MLDVGFPELVLILAIAVLVIGPKDIPKIMHGAGRIFQRFRYMRYAFTQQFDDLVRQAELEDLQKAAERSTHDEIDAEIEEDALHEVEEIKKAAND